MLQWQSDSKYQSQLDQNHLIPLTHLLCFKKEPDNSGNSQQGSYLLNGLIWKLVGLGKSQKIKALGSNYRLNSKMSSSKSLLLKTQRHNLMSV